ncbi:hypothetical protein ISCGN_008870 [Ixodes scapularis]
MFFLVPNAVLLLICASLGAAGEGAGATTTTAAPELTLMESARQMIGNLMDSGSSDMKRSILAADISSQCSLGLLKLMRGIRNLEPWAVRPGGTIVIRGKFVNNNAKHGGIVIELVPVNRKGTDKASYVIDRDPNEAKEETILVTLGGTDAHVISDGRANPMNLTSGFTGMNSYVISLENFNAHLHAHQSRYEDFNRTMDSIKGRSINEKNVASRVAFQIFFQNHAKQQHCCKLG